MLLRYMAFEVEDPVRVTTMFPLVMFKPSAVYVAEEVVNEPLLTVEPPALML